ncbi:MAG: tetratricopeptide repeat protein [Cyanobium sp.]
MFTESVGRRRWQWFSGLSLAITLVLPLQPARALVPFVYLPQTTQLEAAGLGIAQAAARLLRMGQAEDAARLAELTVRLLPGDPRGWVLLAEAELRSNETEKALKALGRAKQLDPNNPGIWFAEGSLALRNAKPQEAIGLLNRGLQLDPRNSGAYFDLGNAQLLLGQSDKALGSFEQAAKLRKDFWEAINNQGLVLWEAGRRTDALERWRRVLKIKPDVPETSLAMAAALFVTSPQERSEALRLAELALNEDPNYVLDVYQKEQLWGEKLRADTRRLLSQPELKSVVERAAANATAGDDKSNES